MEDNQFKILATEVKAGLELLSVKMDDKQTIQILYHLSSIVKNSE